MADIDLTEHVRGCSQLRILSMDAIAATVHLLKNDVTSERMALSYLIKELMLRGISDYWYPSGEEASGSQFGCIVVFDSPGEPRRTAFQNARSLSVSDDVRWTGLGFFYASPMVVDEGTGRVFWGDFASTVYTGSSDSVRRCFRRSWRLSQGVIASVLGNELRTSKEIFETYEQRAATAGVKNAAVSTTAPSVGANAVSMGHTFPEFVGEMSTHNPAAIRKTLAGQRRFIDGRSENPIDGTIWSFEPRDCAEDYLFGAISFHRVFAKTKDYTCEIPDCDRFFGRVGMDWVQTGP